MTRGKLSGSISTFLARKRTASTVPSAYIDLPQTLCWNSNETLQQNFFLKEKTEHKKDKLNSQ